MILLNYDFASKNQNSLSISGASQCDYKNILRQPIYLLLINNASHNFITINPIPTHLKHRCIFHSRPYIKRRRTLLNKHSLKYDALTALLQ